MKIPKPLLKRKPVEPPAVGEDFFFMSYRFSVHHVPKLQHLIDRMQKDNVFIFRDKNVFFINLKLFHFSRTLKTDILFIL